VNAYRSLDGGEDLVFTACRTPPRPGRIRSASGARRSPAMTKASATGATLPQAAAHPHQQRRLVPPPPLRRGPREASGLCPEPIDHLGARPGQRNVPFYPSCYEECL